MADDAFKARVAKEREDLAGNIQRLTQFKNDGNAVYAGLPDDEKQRLARQLSAMGVYRDVLDERIAADFK